jgi:hypothetical protein
MALLMSCLISFVISVFNVGLVEDIMFVWLKAWGFSFVVSFPVVIVVSPLVKKLVDLVIDNNE